MKSAFLVTIALLFLAYPRHFAHCQGVSTQEVATVLANGSNKPAAANALERAVNAGQEDVAFELRKVFPTGVYLEQVKKFERVKQAHLLSRLIADESYMPSSENDSLYGSSAWIEFRQQRYLFAAYGLLNQTQPTHDGILSRAQLNALASQLLTIH